MTRTTPVIMYLVAEDWYFLSHRLPMARAAQNAGYDVHVATHLNGHGARIEALGFTLHPLDWKRGSFNPLDVAWILYQVRRLYQRVRPDLVHQVALQAAVVGSVAAIGLPSLRINALAGLGYGFTSRRAKAALVRPALSALLRRLFNASHSTVLVQNPDDRATTIALGIAPGRICMVPGSGVDIDKLRPLPEPVGPITIAFVGRLLEDKGLRTLMGAFDRLQAHGQPCRLLVAGERDAANPSSIGENDIAEWRQRPGVEFLGQVEDIRDVWRRAHIAVLPSRREGLPKSLLEAAACGRPIVATNVPGCREIARHDHNALLVPPDSPFELACAIVRLADDAQLRARFGRAGRELVEAEFSEERIGRDIVALYDRLLRPDAPAGDPMIA